ncbi:MAG TPA: LPS assembly protein LptD [Candidatus Omnitrophota bacterium]|nr:LPS assembly protein LptD [Candidatus Omnitrophota bacterium]HPN55365.1 LPS assembly protein LptD [Candidatus Omnitrophota bacterium]
MFSIHFKIPRTKRNRPRLFLWGAFLLVQGMFFSGVAGAGGDITPVEINGDRVEYLIHENKVVAQGNVSVKKEGVTLLCDSVEFSNQSSMAYAEGNVVLIRGNQRLTGDSLNFNFSSMKGDFEETVIAAEPFYGAGEKVSRIAENHLVLDRGFITTCDLDDPHFRFVARKIDIYPGDKAVARNVRLQIGQVPIFYLPKYTQDLTGRKPAFLVTPGYDKDWGPFLLGRWRYELSPKVKGTVHVDYRQKKDVAWGVDTDYKTDRYGHGLIRTYYMNERDVKADYFFDERTEPTVERERYKVEWRHKWNVDQDTSAVLQYYRLSDAAFLKDYFQRENEAENNPSTYFLLSRNFPTGTLSFRTDARVNRFTSIVERLPEISYALPNRELGNTGFYFKDTSTYSNLSLKPASPSEDALKTMRVDSENELSYPLKVSFIEVKPYAGLRQTYYSRTKDPADYNSVRGLFFTGSDLSTKFYKIYEAYIDQWGLDIKRLRHVVTPSVSYLYRHDPTLENEALDQFDSIDSQVRAHSLNFNLENKFQTKRQGKSVDLARVMVGTNFLLKEDPGKGGFNTVSGDLELMPYDWWSLYFDAGYDTIEEHLSTANVDFYINDEGDQWYGKFGKRFNREVDDQLTTELGWRVNPKWTFNVYHRFDLDTGALKEQQYGFKRDLHAWTMALTFNETRGEGTEIWVVMTMKAFPEIGFDVGTSFNRRKAGSQN